MNMYKLKEIICLLSLAFLASCKLYSQVYRKVVIIDTLQTASAELNLIVQTDVDTSKLRSYKFIDSIESNARFQKGHIDEVYPFSGQNKRFPNVIIELHSSDTKANISLPLDDSGGLLILKGAFSVKYDTIRIGKHIVYHNCLPDTLKASLGWFKNYNSDKTKPLKLLKSKQYQPKAIPKNCNENSPSAGTCTINSNIYQYFIKVVENTEEVEWAHGHKTMSRKRERMYEYRRQNGKPYTYFAYCRTRFKYALSAEIYFND